MDLYLVTGHTKGLGQALVALLSRQPDTQVVALGRVAEGPIPGGIQLPLDCADTAALGPAFARVEAHVAGRHFAKAVLVNNAGVITPIGPLERADPAAVERSLAVNLVAPVLLMRHFLAAFAGRADLRRVINISSGAARRPIFGWGPYCTAKAGLDMATRAVALEAQAAGGAVQAVSVAPGVIDTPMQGTVRGASAEDFVDIERFRALKAEGQLRDPADVAADLLRHERSGKLFADPIADLRTLGA